MTSVRFQRFLGCASLVGAVAFAGMALPHGESQHGSDAASQLKAGDSLLGSRQLFLDRCASCHGPHGHGTAAAANDFAEPGALVRLDAQTIEKRLREDHEGRLIGPLEAHERDRVIGFVRNYLMLPAPDADTEIGRSIYARTCSVCHGDRGDAASWAKNSLYPPPADFTAHGQEQLTREKMIETVTFGEDGTAMMPFAVQLSREEIAATVDYIREAFMPEGMGTTAAGRDHGHGEGHEAGHQEEGEAHADSTAPFPDGIVGDPAWGKQFFLDNCAECHGENGDGKGRRAYFMIKKPENFRSREARAEFDRPHLMKAIGEGAVGTTMPAWSKVLSPQQIANVGEYVYRAYIHPDQYAETGTEEGPAWKRMEPEPAGSKKN